MTVKWRGKPVFIRHRTAEEISEADAVPLSELRDPQTDAASGSSKPEWLVVSASAPISAACRWATSRASRSGDYGGWFCPCHGSHYDTSGRIRKGPAPLNLPVPEYAFLTDTSVRIG